MDHRFQDIFTHVDPVFDHSITGSIDGPRYRCSLTLRDGLILPCAVLQSKTEFIEEAKRWITDGISGNSLLGCAGPLGEIISSFAAEGNRVDERDVVSAAPSPFAPPLSLLQQIRSGGETLMGWTGWVFGMRDGARFACGSAEDLPEFLDLPAGYTFDDVVKVYHHSYLSRDGTLCRLPQGVRPPPDYGSCFLLRARRGFICNIEEMPSPLRLGAKSG